jgi:hypothetical protein
MRLLIWTPIMTLQICPDSKKSTKMSLIWPRRFFNNTEKPLRKGNSVTHCIDAYTRACLEKGSDFTEMTEALHVATVIRGASLVHRVQMGNIAEKLLL